MICKKTIQAISGTTLFRYLRIWLKANTAIVISGFIVVSFLSFSVFQIVSLNETVMDTLEENGYKSYEAEIRTRVERLLNELDELDKVYAKTDLSESKKRELIIDFVRSKNFSDDDEEYFFILKMNTYLGVNLFLFFVSSFIAYTTESIRGPPCSIRNSLNARAAGDRVLPARCVMNHCPVSGMPLMSSCAR